MNASRTSNHKGRVSQRRFHSGTITSLFIGALVSFTAFATSTYAQNQPTHSVKPNVQLTSSTKNRPSDGRHPSAKAHSTAHLKSHTFLSNIAPMPSFAPSCTTTQNSVQCIQNEIDAIDNAHREEQLPPINVQAKAFARLTIDEQILTITNLERTARGLTPIAALTQQLNTAAAHGARISQDPVFKGWTLAGGRPVTTWASNWAGGVSVLEADYLWMYDDGTGFNVDCPTTTAAGCWGHRANILLPNATAQSCPGSSSLLLMGAAESTLGFHGATSVAELFAESCGTLPSNTTVTWVTVQHLLS